MPLETPTVVGDGKNDNKGRGRKVIYNNEHLQEHFTTFNIEIIYNQKSDDDFIAFWGITPFPFVSNLFVQGGDDQYKEWT